MQQFNAVVHENSFRAFTADVEAYVQEFGSWQEGHRTIPFGRWAQERRGARGRGAGPGRGGQAASGLAVTITLGVDGHVGRGSVEAMLAAADQRLYEGKKNGRHKVCREIEEARA